MFQEHSIKENQCFWERCCVSVEPKHTTHTSGGPKTDPQLEKHRIIKHLANFKATQKVLLSSPEILPPQHHSSLTAGHTTAP